MHPGRTPGDRERKSSMAPTPVPQRTLKVLSSTCCSENTICPPQSFPDPLRSGLSASSLDSSCSVSSPRLFLFLFLSRGQKTPRQQVSKVQPDGRVVGGDALDWTWEVAGGRNKTGRTETCQDPPKCPLTPRAAF